MSTDGSASERIDRLIAETHDWRGEILAAVRRVIVAVDPAITEAWKWMGSPVWERDGMIAVATVLKNKVKLTFSHGAALPDPDRVFNAGLDGGTWRAIDFAAGDAINEEGLQGLVRAAIAYNQAKLRQQAVARTRGTVAKAPAGSAKAAKRTGAAGRGSQPRKGG